MHDAPGTSPPLPGALTLLLGLLSLPRIFPLPTRIPPPLNRRRPGSSSAAPSATNDSLRAPAADALTEPAAAPILCSHSATTSSTVAASSAACDSRVLRAAAVSRKTGSAAGEATWRADGGDSASVVVAGMPLGSPAAGTHAQARLFVPEALAVCAPRRGARAVPAAAAAPCAILGGGAPRGSTDDGSGPPTTPAHPGEHADRVTTLSFV